MFTARLGTAAVLLTVCVAAMFVLSNRWWSAALVPVVLAASREWSAFAGYGRAGRWAFGLIILVSVIVIWFGSEPAAAAGFSLDVVVYGAACAFWLLIAPVWLASRWRIRAPLALGVVGWLVLVPTWLALARMQSDPARLLAVLGIVWLADTAAYLAGRAWGRRRLASAISPSKTWEGVAGTGAAVAVYYGVLYSVTPGWSWWTGVGGAALFAGVTVMSVVGDLFESWMKREAGVKDSGTLLPGHGGILDRIDSLTASMPFAALLLLYFR
jgi:phosphatidate cytidylyltransferase